MMRIHTENIYTLTYFYSVDGALHALGAQPASQHDDGHCRHPSHLYQCDNM
jgi:hypothetical protein